MFNQMAVISNLTLLVLIWSLYTLFHIADSTKLSVYTDKKPCTILYHQMWCAGAQLFRIPPLEPRTPENITTYMDLSENNISRISWELQLYPELEYLNLENNTLKELHTDAFYHLERLEELNLAKNKLRAITLNEDTFQSQSKLRILDLSRNAIGPELPFDMFRYLPSLTCLNLENNGIVTLTSAAANTRTIELNSLTELNLRNNYLVRVPTPVWKITPNLLVLDMTNNTFVRIEPWSFSHLNELKSLSLSHLPNLQIVEDSALNGLINLEILNLNGCNNLHSIKEHALQGCLSLTHVNLSSNALTTLQKELLSYSSLQTLYFNNNKLTCDCSLLWIPRNPAMNKLIGVKHLVCTDPESGHHRQLLDLTKRDVQCPQQSGSVDDSGDHSASVDALSAEDLFIVVMVCILLLVVSSVAGYFIKQIIVKNQGNVHYQYWVLK